METNSVNFFGSEDYPDLPNKPFVAAWKIKNPQNTGSLIRLLDNLGGTDLFLIDEENQKRESRMRKTAGVSMERVRVHAVTADWFFGNLPPGFSVCGIETSAGSENVFKATLPAKVVFLLGSEIHGLPEQIIGQCQQVVHIPMTGPCKSMNVSHALAVVMFEWMRQQLFL